ncbi:IS21-like element helper ATPase IstB [Methylacidiphilum caldifontis]|uniref:Transposase n=1 Tax=Methylacidiphilum caldifontis TaxID=2795386 RepID=A0A4Y8P6M7_9BACT|nr:IS21-like element helper ATPase IstB [Methylacidiphilum caldifontis]TFE65733.1 transposase [Methylacidiphilum caldifontis]
MLPNATRDHLQALRLSAMAEAWARQQTDPTMAELSFDERFGLLVDAEWVHRQNRRWARRLREAQLRLAASPEAVDYQVPRGLDRGQFQQLLTGQWILTHQTVLLTGPAGCGKTFLACALGHAACRQDRRVRYIRLSRLLGELLVARLEHTYPQALKAWAQVDLLIVDDWGEPLNAEQARDLWEILDDRYQRAATIITSQVPIAQWHGLFADSTIADAILDRVVHQAYRIELRGESLRKTLPPAAASGTTES